MTTSQSLRSAAISAILLLASSSTARGFVNPSARAAAPLAGSNRDSCALSSGPLDFDLPPGINFDDTYEQGQVPLYSVVNATMRQSKLIYSFSAMKIDIRNNPDAWVDGQDMIDGDILSEGDIVEFIAKNRERIEQPDFVDLLDYEMGIKGDNRLRCVDAEDALVELVYGINVNRSRKQVTVAFRGTNTNKDLLVDADLRKYPAFDEDGTKFDLHNGFRNYLMAKTADEDDGDLTKLDEITNKLVDMMEEDTAGYDVYITGHSLGGALSTLYGFKLAKKRLFPVVNVVSVASPYVGTDAFKKEFREAELEGILRHIRVSNKSDCIPANPCIGGFNHVGVNLELRKKEGPVINYEGVDNPSLPLPFVAFLAAFGSIAVKALSVFVGPLGYLPVIPLPFAGVIAYACVNSLLGAHGFPQYRERLQTNLKDKEFLSKTIEQVYEKRLAAIRAEGA